jgi:hypothetical protein
MKHNWCTPDFSVERKMCIVFKDRASTRWKFATAEKAVTSFCFHSTGVVAVPGALSCRLVYLGVYLTAVTLCAAYSATLVSSLAVRKNALPFKTFEDLLKTNEYQINVVNNSAVLSEFEVSFRIRLHDVIKITWYKTLQKERFVRLLWYMNAILLLIKRYNLYKVLASSTTFFQLSLFCANFFQLLMFMLFISS